MTTHELLLQCVRELSKIRGLEFHESEAGCLIFWDGHAIEAETQPDGEYLMLRRYLYTYSEEDELETLRRIARANLLLAANGGGAIGTMSTRREVFLFKRVELNGLDARELEQGLGRMKDQ